MQIAARGILFAATIAGAWAQTPDAKLSFEVASVKPSAPPSPGGFMRFGHRGGPGTNDPGRFTCENCSLSNLLTTAYAIQHYQLTAPAWLNEQRFDIAAKIPEGTTKEQFGIMLRNLLAERFGLKAHREKKEISGYELVPAKNGSKLKESTDDPANTEAPPPPAGPGRMQLGKDGFPVMPAGRGPMMIMMPGKARMRTTAETMEHFAEMLANQLGRPVSEATGLKGKYDFELTWATEGSGLSMMGRGGPMPPPPPGPLGGGIEPPRSPEEDNGPSLMTALQEQLGLRLEQKKVQTDIVVVDHMEKTPAEN